MKKLILIALMACALFGVVTPALAQSLSAEGYPFEAGAQDNFFLYSEMMDRTVQQYSPSNSTLELDGLGRLYEDTYISSNLESPNMWCKEGGPNIAGCVNPDADIEYSEPGERVENIVAFDAMAGLHDTMTAHAYADQVNKLLSSEMAVLNTTWLMTEPGVAGGVANSMAMANAFLQNRYLSDISFIKRAENLTNSKEIILSAYNGCIAQGIRDGKTWVNSHSDCLGGARTNSAAPFVAVNPSNTGYKMENNANHHTKIANGTAIHSSGTYMKAAEDSLGLAELLFGQESDFVHQFQWLGEAAGTTTSDNNEDTLARMIESWRRIFGDIEFSIEAEGGSPILKNISVRKIPPTVNQTTTNVITGSAGERRAGGEWYFRNLTKSIYREINNMMYNACQFKNRGDCVGTAWSWATVTAALDPWEWIHDSDKGFFWDNDKCLYGTGAGLKRTKPDMMSMRGFWMQPHLINLLYFFFTKNVYRDRDGWMDCDTLNMDSPTSESSLEHIMGLISSASNTDQGIRRGVNQRIRLYFYLAKKIALGQTLMMFKKAEEHLMSLSVGAYDDMVRRYGLEMIYQAAGTEDIMEAYEKNLAELRFSIEGLYQRYANQIGKTDTLARAGQSDDSSTDAINPHGYN